MTGIHAFCRRSVAGGTTDETRARSQSLFSLDRSIRPIDGFEVCPTDLPYALSALVDPSLPPRDARRIQRRDGLLPERIIEDIGDVHLCNRQFRLAGRGRWKICAALPRYSQSLRQAFVGRQTANRALLCPAKQVLECLAVCARPS